MGFSNQEVPDLSTLPGDQVVECPDTGIEMPSVIAAGLLENISNPAGSEGTLRYIKTAVFVPKN